MKENYYARYFNNAEVSDYYGGGNVTSSLFVVEAESESEAIAKASEMLGNGYYVIGVEAESKIKAEKAEREARAKAEAEKAEAKKKAKAEREKAKAEANGMSVEEYRKAKAKEASKKRLMREIAELEKELARKKALLEKY